MRYYLDTEFYEDGRTIDTLEARAEAAEDRALELANKLGLALMHAETLKAETGRACHRKSNPHPKCCPECPNYRGPACPTCGTDNPPLPGTAAYSRFQP